MSPSFPEEEEKRKMEKAHTKDLGQTTHRLFGAVLDPPPCRAAAKDDAR